MKLKINKNYENFINKKQILDLIKEIPNNTPYLSNNKRDIYFCKINDMIIFLKKFKYQNKFLKFIKHRGYKSYKISEYLVKKNIKTPEPVFYLSLDKYEFFATKRIESNNLFDFIKRQEMIDEKRIVDGIKRILKQFSNYKIYHSDFDLTNILIDNDYNLFVVDVESIRFNLTKRRKEKMVRKLNKFFKKLGKIQI